MNKALPTLLALLTATPTIQAAISYTLNGGVIATNFDALPTTGTNVVWANDSTITGWNLFTKDSAAITAIDAGTGSSTGGKFYSFGPTGDSDRALGGLASAGAYFGSPASGSVAGWIAVSVTNNTLTDLDVFTINYDGEQWRNGGNATAQTMVLEYGFGSSFSTVAAWTAPGTAFNFTSPIATATAATLNGNDPANRAAGLGGSVSGLTWTPGSTLWVRWTENNDAGNDHALSIDNVSFSAVPEPSVVVLGLAAFMIPLRRKR